MNFINMFVFISIFNGGFCQISDIKSHKGQETEVISTFISKACEDFFIEKSIKFIVMVYGVPTERLDDISNGLVVNLINKYPMLPVINLESIFFSIDISMVILMKDKINFQNYRRESKIKLDPGSDQKVFIYIDELDLSKDEPIADLRPTEYLIHNSEDFLFLSTLIRNCMLNSLEILYVFDKNLNTLTQKDKNYNKYENIYGCRVLIYGHIGRMIYFKEYNEQVLNCLYSDKNCQSLMHLLVETEEPEGLMIDIFNILSKIHNFKPIFRVANIFLKRDISDEGKIKFPTVEIGMPEIGQTDYYRTSSIHQYSKVYVIRSIIPISYDLLTRPFDLLTWIVVFMSLGVAFVVIFYMNLRLGTVRICPRKELTRPALNVLQIVFGCQQKKLPRANFTRFLIILFISLCFVLRICYWSQLVGFMATGVKRMSLKDLMHSNYTIYSSPMMQPSKDIRR